MTASIKTLLLDIETSPNVGYHWGLFKQNISLGQLIETSRMLCWAAKWKGEDYTIFSSEHMTSRKAMVKELHNLMCEADEIVTYNGDRFDLPIINREFLTNDMGPASPYKSVDLLKTIRKNFKFSSNKLQHIVDQLDVGHKLETGGFDLWVKCLAKDPEAWELMEEYNRMDAVLLDELYDILLPWASNTINRSVFHQDEVCPKCGGTHYVKDGFRYTTAGIYQSYRCKDCGGYFQSNKTLAKPEKFK